MNTERTISKTDNIGTDTIFITADILAEENADILRRLEQFEARAAALPDFVSKDDDANPRTDLLAEMKAFGLDVETARNKTQAPYETAVATARAWFFAIHAPRAGQTPGRLQQAMATVSGPLLAYLERKEKLLREARAAEAKRLYEEQQAAIAKQQAELAKQRAAEDAGRAKAAANAGARAAEAAAAASTAEAEAFEARQQSLSKPADLARTRSDSGALATPAVEWDFEIPDIEAVKGAKLWEHVTRAAKEAAIRKYISANAPKVQDPNGPEWQPLPGVRMICKRKLQVRR